MNISYIWKIGQLQIVASKNGLSNVVQSVDWKLIANDGNYSVENSANTWLEDADPSKFVQFESLDETTVLSWIQQSLGQSLIDSFKSNLLAMLEEKKNLTTKIVSPPWQS